MSRLVCVYWTHNVQAVVVLPHARGAVAAKPVVVKCTCRISHFSLAPFDAISVLRRVLSPVRCICKIIVDPISISYFEVLTIDITIRK